MNFVVSVLASWSNTVVSFCGWKLLYLLSGTSVSISRTLRFLAARTGLQTDTVGIIFTKLVIYCQKGRGRESSTEGVKDVWVNICTKSSVSMFISKVGSGVFYQFLIFFFRSCVPTVGPCWLTCLVMTVSVFYGDSNWKPMVESSQPSVLRVTLQRIRSICYVNCSQLSGKWSSLFLVFNSETMLASGMALCTIPDHWINYYKAVQVNPV